MALRNLTLDRLLLLIGCAILVVFFLPVVLVVLWQIPKEREAALIERSHLVAQGLVQASLDALLTDDLLTVKRLMREAVNGRDVFRYAILLDSGRHPVLHTFDDGIPSALHRFIRSDREEVVAFRSSDGSLFDLETPVMDGLLGTMHLGISRSEINRAQQTIVWTATILLAAALGILLFGVRKVSLLVSRPLVELERTTRAYLRDGDEDELVADGGATVEVRAIAARFLRLLQQMSRLESHLPRTYRDAFRGKKDHRVASIMAAFSKTAGAEDEGLWSTAYLEHRYDWLVFHRWVAIAGIIIAWLIYVLVWQQSGSVPAVMGSILFMVLWNSFLQARNHWPVLVSRFPLTFWLLAQIISDLVILTFLLHLFGGMENPFKLFYVFLMVIAGLTFHIRISGLLALTGSTLYGTMIYCEMASYLPHNTLFYSGAAEASAVWTLPRMVLGEVVGMTLIQIGVSVFVHTVSVRRQRAEAARKAAETIALSRERMAILGELAAGVAHEVRNPIHGLLNCCSLLRDKVKPSEEQTELVSLLDEGLRRISTISDRLLRLSHPSERSRDPVDLHDVVSSTADLLRESSRKRGVAIEIVEPSDIPLVTGDADRLREAILNLLNNSLDAFDTGGTITVRLEAIGAPPDTVRLIVADSGSGIPPDVLPRIFDPFFTTKAVGQGSGLGLALVNETVHYHGGTIEVESAPDKGTTVTILLPAMKDESDIDFQGR